MDKLRVAVIMEDTLPTEGGGYSYYQTMLANINKHSFHPDIEIVNLDVNNKTLEPQHYGKRVIRVQKSFLSTCIFRCLGLLYKVIHRLLKDRSTSYLVVISRGMDNLNNGAARKTLIKEKVHFVYYLKPKENLIDYPMIVTHWDVGHRSMYPFPEVAWNGNYQRRDKYYETILSKAFLVLCESETGAKELKYYYPVNPEKIKVMPLFGGAVVSINVPQQKQELILESHQLIKGNFFLYPAQFWAHKNHTTLVQAFNLLVKNSGDVSLKLVLCGGDQGNLSYIKELISELGLNNQVLIPGFISDEHLFTFYKNAAALVMPTFLGPTNIPLIEAAYLNCAVTCSNLEGHKEILGNNALYFDPASVSGIFECMKKMLDDQLRLGLVSSAYNHIKDSPFQVEKSIPLLDRFLQQLKPVRLTWGINFNVFFAFIKLGFFSFN